MTSVSSSEAPSSMVWGGPPRLYLSYGIASLQGKRPSLSDAVAAVPSFSALSPPLGLDYFAVFDGYRGTAVAKYLQERLCEAIAQGIQDELITWNPRFLRSDNNAAEWWKVTMEVAFWSVDTRLIGGNAVEDDVTDVGATALVALVHENYVVLASCGFSKAVMSRGGEAVLLTPEHEEDVADMQEWAEKHRVCMTRAKLEKAVETRLMFGTSMCKEEEEMVPPEVITVERDPEDEYLILASDGLWESMTPASACAFVRLRLFATARETDARGSPTLLAKELAEDAINKGSQDNISVVIILFRDFWNYSLRPQMFVAL